MVPILANSALETSLALRVNSALLALTWTGWLGRFTLHFGELAEGERMTEQEWLACTGPGSSPTGPGPLQKSL